MNENQLQKVLDKLQGDWGVVVWGGHFILKEIKFVGEDPSSLTRTFQTRSIELIQDGDCEFARSLPSSLSEWCLNWTLKWEGTDHFSDPTAFVESHYDADAIGECSFDWDDQRVASDAIACAVVLIDWDIIAEEYDEYLGGASPNYSVFPKCLQASVRNALEKYQGSNDGNG